MQVPLEGRKKGSKGGEAQLCYWYQHPVISIPGKGDDGIGWGWIAVGQSSQSFKWTGAHIQVLRACGLFL